MTDQPKPKFPMHDIPQSLWMAVAAAQSTGFADSYLYGAVLRGRQLIPRTMTGHDALRSKCSEMLSRLEIRLEKPAPFHQSGRPSVVEEMPQFFGGKR